MSFSQVPLDERFIYRFFREKKSRVSDEQDSDAESVNSEDAMEAIEMFADSGTRDLDFAAAIEPDQKSGLCPLVWLSIDPEPILWNIASEF